MKLGSWPPAVSAPFRIGTLRSGAVSSSWTWNLLSFVFISLHSLYALTGGKYTAEMSDLVLNEEYGSDLVRDRF
jgi:hypothetical protein